jgi:hypothetical protein
MVWKPISDYPASPNPYRPTTPPANPHCTQCGHRLETRHKFCPECGTARTTQHRLKDQCQCGAAFAPKDRHCGSCGRVRPGG